MTKNNPDDSVQDEQFEADDKTAEIKENSDEKSLKAESEDLKDEEPANPDSKIESKSADDLLIEKGEEIPVDSDTGTDVEAVENSEDNDPIDEKNKEEETVVISDVAAESIPEDAGKDETVGTDKEKKEDTKVISDVAAESIPEDAGKDETVGTDKEKKEDTKVISDVAAESIPEDAGKDETVGTDKEKKEDTKVISDVAAESIPEDAGKDETVGTDKEKKEDSKVISDIISDSESESESQSESESEEPVKIPDSITEDKVEEIPSETKKQEEPITSKPVDGETDEKPTPEKDSASLEKLPDVDYSTRSLPELVETLELLIENRPADEIKDDIEKIKTLFYKKHKSETEKKKSAFLDEGGKPEDFKPAPDPLEEKLKRFLTRYRGKRSEFSRQLEVEKQDNLKKKYDIIDKIKDLVNREESINKTFQEFRDLQSEWHSTGVVPQAAVKNLWETYNYNVEIFYDYIKINKELRDLDFKKNLETKIRLCEKAEELLLEPNPINAFRILQEHHQRWREIGPVPRETRSDTWERFREATSKINRRHHEYFEGQKEEQKNNLEAKSGLCEQVEAINNLSIKGFKEWEDKAKEVIELQKVWRTIGFAPKKHNNSIYQRFREGCDEFFQNKRKFYAENKEMQQDNLQLKTELCVQAEALQDSTNWKESTDDFIRLQRKWKEIGTVPRKYSDKVWKRFRKACDHFFNKKAEHFSELDTSFEDNLKLKNSIIKELEEFEPGDDFQVAFEKLKEIQKKWSEIGFVPYKEKDEVSNRYRNILNKQFDLLQIDEDQKAIIKYRNKIDNLKENPKASRKLRTERERFFNRIKQLEGDIVLWENNIGFFSKSSNADSMIKEVQQKIDSAKTTIQVLEEKIRLIDQSGMDN